MTVIEWLESHEKLSGWAQFLGAMLALIATYLTAFLPIWLRKRQLRRAALRLLLNGYEVLESYHRTSARFLPIPLSIRQATLTMTSVADEISRFPVFELDDQGFHSTARYLIALGTTLNSTCLVLEDLAVGLEGRVATLEDQEMLRAFVSDRLELVRTMMATKMSRSSKQPADNKKQAKEDQ